MLLSHAISPQLLPLAWVASHAAFPIVFGAAAHARPVFRGAGHPCTLVHLLNKQQATAGFAARAAHQPNSDEDASTTSSTHSLGDAAAAAACAAHHSKQQLLDSWLPQDVKMAMRNHVYPTAYLEAITPKHLPPDKLHQKLALRAVQTIRSTFDLVSGYRHDRVMDEAHWLRRIIFLETVAGVPGMVAGMLRHLKSLRLLQRDNGWINTLLEEAENERMHLLTFMEMRQPGVMFRGMVIAAQTVFFSAFSASYMISPKFCHAFVGYLEEEAVKTYTLVLQEIDAGRLWPDTPAPRIACYYWGLPEGARMRELVLAVRADEAHHSHVNHTFARLPQDGPNPFTSKDSHMVP